MAAARSHSSAPAQVGPWKREFVDYVRAFSGAFVFGIPLLFTMEMWWIGEFLARWQLVSLVAVALAVNTGLSHASGFRDEKHTLRNSLWEAVEVLGVGIVGSLVVLLALNRFTIGDPLDGIVGMIIVQSIPLSIGASVANMVFDPDSSRASDDDDATQGQWEALFNDVGATIAGAMFVGATIAPTEEVPMLAASLTFPYQLAVIALTLCITYGIVFASGFDPTHRDSHGGGLFQGPFSETMLAYALSLVVALLLLALLGHLDTTTPIEQVLREVLVLGVPAAIGAAAGRVVI